MAIDFPASPTNGQQYTYGAATYVYDSSIPGWLAYPTLPGGVPAGTIVQWGTNTAPANWMICDGTAISRSTYASLFQVIGTTYGSGDGSTTFNLPDLRGRVPVGKNGGSFGTLAATGGSESVTLTAAQIPGHTHSGTTASAGNHTHTYSGTTNTTGAHTHQLQGSNGGSSGVSMAVTGNTNNDFGFGPMNGARANSAGDHAHTFSGTTSDVSTTHTHTFTTDNGTGGGGSHTNVQPYLVLNYIIKTSMANTPGDSALATRVGALETFNTVAQSVSVGGTGATSFTSGAYLKGAGTSAVTAQAGIPATDITSGTLATARLPTIPVANGGTGNTTGSGLVPIVPSSVSVSSGTGSFNSSTGVVTFTGATSLSIYGVFSSAYENYRMIVIYDSTSGGTDVNAQLLGSSNLTAGYTYYRSNVTSAGLGYAYTASQSTANILRSQGTYGLSGWVDIYGPAIATYKKFLSASVDNAFYTMSGNINGNAGIYNGINITVGGTASGRIIVYGYR